MTIEEVKDVVEKLLAEALYALPTANRRHLVSNVVQELKMWNADGSKIIILESNLVGIFNEEESLRHDQRSEIISQIIGIVRQFRTGATEPDLLDGVTGQTDEQLNTQALEEVTRCYRIFGA